MYGVNDIDFVFFDSDLSEKYENEILCDVTNLNQSGLKVDVKNEARVHLWYQEHFGYPIEPYTTLEDAISTWPTTASSIGARIENGKLKVFAPFGLDDLFGLIVRANKRQITERIYYIKAGKWKSKWPELTVVPW
jgi:hypothetical protein